jgi:hypothetical protein
MIDLSEQYVKQFNADLGELSLNLIGESHWRRYASSKIVSIQNTLGKKRVLFVEKPVERIEILVSGEPRPYVIEKGVIKDDFVWIKDVLKRFAEKNKVNYAD